MNHPQDPKEGDITINLPDDLEQVLLSKFDELYERGEILWMPYSNEYVRDGAFEATFQLAPHLAKKPIQSEDDPSRKTGKGGSKNPFLDPDPAFVVSRVGSNHTLLLNKYPVYRPSGILHTNHFAQQSDDLDESDLTAAWAVLQALERSSSSSSSSIMTNDREQRADHVNTNINSQGEDETPTIDDVNQQQQQQQQTPTPTPTQTHSLSYSPSHPKWMIIFNCGVHAGSSQGHKHMQLWPYPDKSETGFDLFPHRLVIQQQQQKNQAKNEIITKPDDDDDREEKEEEEKFTICQDPSLPFLQFTVPLFRQSDPDHDHHDGHRRHDQKDQKDNRQDENKPPNLQTAYTQLLQSHVLPAHTQHHTNLRTYNVCLTLESLTLIPRRHSGIEYKAGSNTAGMLGLIWIADRVEMDVWRKEAKGSLPAYLAWLGIGIGTGSEV